LSQLFNFKEREISTSINNLPMMNQNSGSVNWKNKPPRIKKRWSLYKMLKKNSEL